MISSVPFLFPVRISDLMFAEFRRLGFLAATSSSSGSSDHDIIRG